MQDKELKSQLILSTLKSSISSIPILGEFLGDYLFEVRGRIKQERINTFVSSFADYLTDTKEIKLQPEQVEKEQFGDFFEEVIRKVAQTSSEKKRQAFKRLLADQLTIPKDYDYAELLLQIIGSLQESQIPILYDLYNQDDKAVDLSGQLIQAEKNLDELTKQRNFVFSNKKGDPSDDPQYKLLCQRQSNANSEVYRIKMQLGIDPYSKHKDVPFGELRPGFLLQDLCNKGLAIDVSMKYAASPLKFVKITRLGADLIQTLS